MVVAIVIKRMEGFLEVAFPKGSGVPSMGIAAAARCPTITPEELVQLLREVQVSFTMFAPLWVEARVPGTGHSSVWHIPKEP